VRLVVFDDYRIGVLREGLVHDVSSLLSRNVAGTRWAMLQLIEDFDVLRPRLNAFVDASNHGRPIADLRLLPPVPAPAHIFAAPLNYRDHVEEMEGSAIVSAAFQASSAAKLGFFLKAPGSLIGASGSICLPELPGRVFHHEPELCAVIGRPARAVSSSQALDYVFGYTCLLDITVRNTPEITNERTMRKSYETFTPLGPVLVTADEIEDPGQLDIALEVNGEVRQKANTRDLIVPVPDLISEASKVLTLQPGDLYATGTPDGVGPINPGDLVSMRIEKVCELRMPVKTRAW
jgi:2-keto-4-pentenoate hydratase/2-oxohepta-3-ene-1,7-dioic acid hydratase in catechol pathway